MLYSITQNPKKCTVFNLSIETRVFPDKLNISCGSPVYKAGDSTEVTN